MIELLTFPILGPHGSWKSYSKEDILNADYNEAKIGQEFGMLKKFVLFTKESSPGRTK